MTLYVLSPALDTLGVVNGFKSFVHTAEFSGSGSFKLLLPFSVAAFKLLQQDNYLYWTDAGRGHTAVIETIVVGTQKDGIFITVSGKNIRTLLKRRIVWDNFQFAGTAEDFARKVVNQNVVSPTDIRRKMPIEMAAKINATPTIAIATQNENVETLLDDVTTLTGVGFDIVFDKSQHKLVFKAYQGTDHRTTQRNNPWVIVSTSRNNVVEDEYSASNTSYRNTALIAGYTDEATGVRHTQSITNGTGLDRREMFIQASASKPRADEEEGITQAQAEANYSAEVLETGRVKLAEQTKVESLEVVITSELAKTLHEGDMITVLKPELGLQMQTFVAATTTYFEKGGTSYELTLGDSIPSVYKKLKRGIE